MSMNRRGFLSQMSQLIALAAVFGFGGSAKAEERRRGGGGDAKPAGNKETDKPLVEPGKGAAGPVNYVEDKKKVTNAALKTERQGVKFEGQHCSTCGFYKEVGDKNGKKVGTCMIFPNQLVVGEGWCSSWNKKS